uniref:Uncharacterized protein n=1 Tax=Lepeophtheirus salmonis TaxID=72036 RepID=A0A0K2VB66_LEPSM
MVRIHYQWLISDGKSFYQSRKNDTRNKRWLAKSFVNDPRIVKNKYLLQVMFLALISSDCHAIPPFILKEGQKVNTKA